MNRVSAVLFLVATTLLPQFLRADGPPYAAWKNSTNSCTNNAVFNDLADTLPHQEQIGEFAVFSGTGYKYVAYGSNTGSITVPALPGGSTIVKAYLEQIGTWSPSCCGTGNDGGNWPTTANTTFAGTAFAGTVTGVGDFVRQWLHPVVGVDNNKNWNQGVFNARFDVTSKVTGGGTYAFTNQANNGSMPTAGGSPASFLIIVYADPAVTDNGIVALADGLQYWHPRPYDEFGVGVINDGNRPMATTLNFGCAAAICDPATARFTRMGGLADLSLKQEYTDVIEPPGSPATETAYPAPRFTSGRGVLASYADVDTYVSPAGAFAAGDTRMTWNMGGQSDDKGSFFVNALAFSHMCPTTNTAAATLTKSQDKATAAVGDTMTYTLHYQYNPVGGGTVVTDDHNDNDGLCTPNNWAQGTPSKACFYESGGQAGNMSGTNDVTNSRQIIYNYNSMGTDGVLEVRLAVTQWYGNGIVFRYQGTGDNGYILNVFNGDTGGNPDKFTLYRGTTQIAQWATAGVVWVADGGTTTIRIALTGCAINILTNGPAGGGASTTFTNIGTALDCTYASGFSGYWRSGNNDTVRYDNYKWTPQCGLATNVTVTDSLPASLCFQGMIGAPAPASTGTSPGNVVNWNLGALACGAAGDIVFTAIICNPPPGPSCQFSNTASMSSTTFGNVNANTVTVSVPSACGSPTSTITRTRTPTPTITITVTPTYTITVTDTPTITPTRTPTPTDTITPTFTPTITITVTPTNTVTRTNTPTYTPTPTFTNTYVTPTSTNTLTRTPTPTDTITVVTPTFTITATPTDTPTVTMTATQTITTLNTATFTSTVTVTKTSTPTPTPTPTFTLTSTVTLTRTNTVTATDTSTDTSTPTQTITVVTPSATNTPTRTATPTVTATPTNTLTRTPTSTPTATPSITATPTNTYTISPGPSPTSTDTPTATPTDTSTPTQTMTRTNTATPTFTATDTATRTETLTRTQTVTATPTSTHTPTATITDTETPGPSATNTITPSDTRTITATYTGTLSSTPTSTFSATRSITPTFTATSTRTSTSINTATNTPTNTQTRTITPSCTDSPTLSSTPTRTPTATSTSTITFSATQTQSPTITITFTLTDTPVPEPYHVVLTLYNSAGEVVKHLYSGDSAVSPVDFSSQTVGAPVGGRLPIAINIYGISSVNAPPPIVWLGDNDNGQTVSNGTYYFKLESTDEFGKLTSLVKEVVVLGNTGGNSLAIYNSAGELVRNYPLNGLPSDLVDFSTLNSAALGGDTSVNGGLKVDIRSADGVSHPWSWDGRNDLGALVASGTYTIQLVHTELGSGVTVKSVSVTILQAPNDSVTASLASATVAPNPWHMSAGGDPTITLFYTPLPGHLGLARAYNLAGELVAQGLDANGSGRVTFSGQSLASGIYVLDFEVVEGIAVVGRRQTKFVIVK